MTRIRTIFLLPLLFFVTGLCLKAEQPDPNEMGIRALHAEFGQNGYVQCTGDVVITNRNVILTADSVSANEKTGDVIADGKVRIQRDDQIWTGEHIRYNFNTGQMVSEQFRTGKYPVFVAATGLSGVTNGATAAGDKRPNPANDIYTATNAFITTDDIAEPALKIRARYIRIIPGKRIEATHATLYAGGMPLLYFPFYSRTLEPNSNDLDFIPGYRSAYGAFLLGRYNWILSDQLNALLHLDYRQKRGIGAGPDINFHLGQWGDGAFRYYYTHDDNAGTNRAGARLPENRQRIDFSYQAAPFTNISVKTHVRYQGDSDVVKNFFEGEYRQDPQPDTFFEVNRLGRNFSLDLLTQPRLNRFLETVERLPELKLTGFRQQVGNSPLYYESESSAGYYDRVFPGTNSPFALTNRAPLADFSAARADTYHQITLPETFFGWLNVTPRVGGRLTWYGPTDRSEAGSGFPPLPPFPPSAGGDAATRGVFNTGAEVSFKASRLWPTARNQALDLDGLRHIIVPSVNYVYVPRPNRAPDTLPQFDYELPSLRLLPVEFPEYNAIDAIDSQNVLRFGVVNKLQTKRDGQVDDWLNWTVQTDWRLRPRTNQQTFADLYSDFSLKPRSWLILQSQTRYDINGDAWRMLLHTVTFKPNDIWSWTIGQFYLRDDSIAYPTGLGRGNNLVTSSLFCRVNEDWGFRATHHYDIASGRMQEQAYSVYRDLRSWTAALTGILRNDGPGQSADYSIVFTFSLKARPRFGLGRDTLQPYSLLGQ